MNASFFLRLAVACVSIISLTSPASAARMVGGIDADGNYRAMALDPMFDGTVGIKVEYADGTFHFGTGNVTDLSASGGTNALTVAHVLSSAVAVSVTTSKNMHDPDAVYYGVDDWQYFNPGLELGADIGFMHLDFELPGVTPISVYFGAPLPKGTQLYLAGYGRPSYYPDDTVLSSDGYLRAGTNNISQVGTGGTFPDEYIRMNFGQQAGFPYGPLEYGYTDGDSGGPALYRDLVTGTYSLYAIGKGSNTLSYDSYAIIPQYFAPAYDVFRAEHSVPEPATATLIGLGACSVLRRLRKRAVKV